MCLRTCDNPHGPNDTSEKFSANPFWEKSNPGIKNRFKEKRIIRG